ncbi:MAG: hypothetical protein ACI9VR_002686, partial [Cognaticolwellia sp.]
MVREKKAADQCLPEFGLLGTGQSQMSEVERLALH